MTSSIAATTGGGGGVVTTADASGNLDLKSGTTTILAVTPTGVAVTGDLTMSGAPPVLRSYLAGLTLSTAGASATMSIAAGQAADSTNVAMMNLAATSKTTSAWAVGAAAGGLDTGAIANSTWYHFYAIRRPDTGVVDAILSLSASAPTLPTNYTQYRRIGSGKTNGSAQWTSFTQDGDYFRWAASVADISSVNPGTAAVTLTLASVPTGVSVQAIFNSFQSSGATSSLAYFSDLASTDEAVSSSAAPFGNIGSNSSGFAVGGQFQIRTNTSAQIRFRSLQSDGSRGNNVATLGWIDTRGRNS